MVKTTLDHHFVFSRVGLSLGIVVFFARQWSLSRIIHPKPYKLGATHAYNNERIHAWSRQQRVRVFSGELILGARPDTPMYVCVLACNYVRTRARFFSAPRFSVLWKAIEEKINK